MSESEIRAQFEGAGEFDIPTQRRLMAEAKKLFNQYSVLRCWKKRVLDGGDA